MWKCRKERYSAHQWSVYDVKKKKSHALAIDVVREKQTNVDYNFSC